ncbi:uncharacterized protein KY384_007024 [Bacidia gigantensis]|uniref:uncharacterized protein n=1 Tax=Bacidia gigantensis TaxID=2732470 RepID=UPI001D057235|nr:uncharacterized protein KY384_007024 [Bacidia gigantensis]KAG8528108.1 hypothetical protein KY384_007024 [Bacidia gigantensis]
MTAVVNGNPLTDTNPSGTTSNAAKTQPKTMVSTGKADGSRKQGSVMNDATQKRAPAQKAWQSGMNPITQRSNTPTQQNGAVVQNKSGYRLDESEGGSAEKISHDRLLHLFANAIVNQERLLISFQSANGPWQGNNATLTTKNGDIYTGIFFGASLSQDEPEYLLKMVQHQRRGDRGEVNGVRENSREYIGVGEDHAMSFKLRDVVDFSPEAVPMATQEKRAHASSAQAFRTDADISNRKGGQERELQPWVAPGVETHDQALEASEPTGTWDQFQANENLFGVKSDYDENIYTTRIDKSHPNYRQREAEARRLAQRMGENFTGKVNESEGWDEEDKYSGVKRGPNAYPPLQSNQPNKYQPPARRPPAGKPTVAGAPVDPAIIASQLSKQETTSQLEQITPSEVAENNLSAKTITENSLLKEDQAPPKNNSSNNKSAASNEPKATQSTKLAAPNAAANVEVDVRNAFKQFSQTQKTRVADDKRQRTLQDKNFKLEDLRGFSQRFKLNTPVPQDLVPILAKDPKKQEEIKEKAQRNAMEQANAPKLTSKAKDQGSVKAVNDSTREASKAGRTGNERPDQARQAAPPRGPQGNLPLRERQPPQAYSIPTLPPNEQGLTHRLAKTQRDRQAGVASNVPAPLPILTQKTPARPGTTASRVNSSQGSVSMRTPTSATSGKFNVKAHEFIPNPAANAFTMPTSQPSDAASPRAQGKGRLAVQASSPTEFFGNRKPLPIEDRLSITDNFNPLKRLREKAEKDGKSKDYATNGGIAFAHATPVTWSSVKDGEEGKSYRDMFEGSLVTTGPSPRPLTTSPINSNVAHQNQMPNHLQPNHQTSSNMHTPPQQMYQGPPQQHLYPGMPHQFEDQRMHASPSISSYSTPRAQNAYGTYPMPMGQPMQGPMHGAIQYPPTMGPGHPQMFPPGGPQPAHFRQYTQSPHYLPGAGQTLAAPAMVQQGSQGPYLAQGTPAAHVPVYATGIPQYGPSQPNSGYPSPNRGAPMMMHQGSFQGQNTQMHASAGQYAQPFYSSQPPPTIKVLSNSTIIQHRPTGYQATVMDTILKVLHKCRCNKHRRIMHQRKVEKA